METIAQFSVLMFFSGLAVFGYQAYLWAKLGSWTTITIGMALYSIDVGVPTVSWVGIQQAINWWLTSSLAWNFLVASVAIPSILILGLEETAWKTKR
jgi:hypothetical protein